MFRYRFLDTAGGELEIVELPERIGLGDSVTLSDGSTGTVVDVYDDAYGRDGGVEATLVVEG